MTELERCSRRTNSGNREAA